MELNTNTSEKNSDIRKLLFAFLKLNLREGS